jgi:hypothetical protein
LVISPIRPCEVLPLKAGQTSAAQGEPRAPRPEPFDRIKALSSIEGLGSKASPSLQAGQSSGSFPHLECPYVAKFIRISMMKQQEVFPEGQYRSYRTPHFHSTEVELLTRGSVADPLVDDLPHDPWQTVAHQVLEAG